MEIKDILEKITEISDKISVKYGGLKYLIGVFVLLVGVTFLITPFTPGAFFIIILGLQIIGINLMRTNNKKK